MSKPISEELFSAYLDGELSPEDMELVREHLTDPGNAAKLASLREHQNRLRALPTYALDESFADRVISAIEFDNQQLNSSGPGNASHENHSWRLALAAITSLAAMLLLVLLLGPFKPANNMLGMGASSQPESAVTKGIDEEKTKENVDKTEKRVDSDTLSLPEMLESDNESKDSPADRSPADGIGGEIIRKKQPKIMIKRDGKPGSDNALDGPVQKLEDSISKGKGSTKRPRTNSKGNFKRGDVDSISKDEILKGQSFQSNTNSQLVDEIVYVQVCKEDFDQFAVENTLMSNNIKCDIPKEFLKASKQTDNSKLLSKNKASGGRNEYGLTPSAQKPEGNIRFMMVEAPNEQLIQTFQQLKNVKVNPLVLQDISGFDSEEKQLRGGGGGLGGQPFAGGGSTKSESVSPANQTTEKSERPAPSQLAQTQNRARNYVDPAKLPREDLQRVLRQRLEKFGSQIQTPKNSSIKQQTVDQEKVDQWKFEYGPNDKKFDQPSEIKRLNAYFLLTPEKAVRRMILVIQSDPTIKPLPATQPSPSTTSPKRQEAESSPPHDKK